MEPRRARLQDWMVGALGVVLVVSLFLGWYAPCSTPPGAGACEAGAPVSAWQAFTAIDVVLLGAGLAGVAALALTLAQRTPALPLALTSLATLLALAAAVLAVLRLVVVPDFAGAESGAGAARLLGAWLGTGAALGLLAAMLASIRDERTPAPARSVAEQKAVVRTLSLSSSGEPGHGGGASAQRGEAR